MTRRHGVPLRGADAKHLYEEGPERPQHTVKVLHLDPAVRLGPAQVRAHLQDRVGELPLLRRALRPARLHHPWWEELAAVDVADHLEWWTLEAGGAARDAAVARVLSTLLPRDRPLWRVVVLDAPDQQTLVLAASHALLDGQVSALALTALFGPHREPGPREAAPSPPAARQLARLLLAGPALAVRGVRAARGKRTTTGAAAPFSGAAGPWNGHHPTAQRAYAEAVLPLPAVRAAGAAAGATVTEVLVALVGGAVRATCLDRLSDGRREVVAVVPVASRRDPRRDTPTRANVVGYVFTVLGVRTADPIGRLHAVSGSLRAGRARLAAGDDRLAADGQDWWPALRVVHQGARWVAARTVGRPPASVVVSTVRGPQGPLAVAGSPVVRLASGGLLADELGLNVTAWSSPDHLVVGVVVRPDAGVDVHRLADALAAGLAGLAVDDRLGTPVTRSGAAGGGT